MVLTSALRCRSCWTILLFSSLWERARAQQITAVAVDPTGSYETGTTPTDLVVTFTPANAITTGDITITANAAIFASDTTGGTAAAASLSGAGVTSGGGADISGSGTVYTYSMNSVASTGAGAPVTVTIPALALTTLPTPGTVSVDVQATGNTGTGTATFQVIASPTIVWTGSQEVTDTATSLSVQLEIPKQINTGEELILEASAAIFLTTFTTVTQDSAVGTGAYVDMTNVGDATSTFVVSGNQLKLGVQGSAVTAGTTVTVLIKPLVLAAIPNSLGAVTMTVRTNSGYTFVNAKTGWLTIVASGTGAVSGDPVTWYGNRRAEFELPLHKLTTLLKMPDLEMLAAPFEGAKQEQWIGRIVLRATETQETLAQFDVNRDMSKFDRTSLPNQGLGMLETLNFVVNNKCTSDGYQFMCHEGTWGVFSKIRCDLARYTPCREAVVVTAKHAKISIYTSSAKEYYGSALEAFSHVHFDFDVFDVAGQDKHLLEGALPEMWGWREVSNATRQLLTKGDPVDVTFEAPEEGCTESCESASAADGLIVQ